MLSQITDQSIYIGRSPLYAPKPVDLLGGLTSLEREKVLSLGESRFVPAGKQVFLQGQPHVGILIILNGEIRSYYVSPAGREITLAYWGAGHFVGGPEIFGGGVHIWSGETVKDCQLLFLASDRLRKAILTMPRFSLNIVEGLVFKATCFSALLQFMGTRPACETLAHLLLILASNQSPGCDDVILDQRYTQEELAKMIGTTRQWVAASLARMKKAALLDSVEACIRIRSIDKLRRYAENDT
jgi:CRP-like cAMP-binding protein